MEKKLEFQKLGECIEYGHKMVLNYYYYNNQWHNYYSHKKCTTCGYTTERVLTKIEEKLIKRLKLEPGKEEK